MSIISIALLFLCVGIIGYGFALFVLESPYLKPLANFCKRKGEGDGKLAKLFKLLYDGLNCATCSGFWGGILGGLFFVKPMALSDIHLWPLSLLWVFLCGLVGSAFSTGAYYLMGFYFDWRKLKEVDEKYARVEDMIFKFSDSMAAEKKNENSTPDSTDTK